MSSFEQANMLLSGAKDANDSIRDANNVTTNTWNSQTKKMDEAEKAKHQRARTHFNRDISKSIQQTTS